MSDTVPGWVERLRAARLRAGDATEAGAMMQPTYSMHAELTRPPGHHLCLEPDGEVGWVPDKPDDDAEPIKQTRKRKPSVANVIRQMQRAGVEVAGCEINPRDGTVRIITGKPGAATTPDGNDMDDADDASIIIDRSEWN